MEEVIPHSYVAREHFRDFHRRSERFGVIVAHRRAGKTVACINDLIQAANGNLPEYQRDELARKPHTLQYAYIAPLYRQAKQVSWDYLKQYGLQYYGAEASESELRVDFMPTEQAPNGGRVRLYGADNPDSLRGIYLDGVILDEAADMSPRINEVIRPTLSDYKGWCIWIGTPRGQNDFYDLCFGTKTWVGAKNDPNWYFKMLKASESGVLDSDELELARAQMTREQYAQEYECSFVAAILGAYYGEDLEEAETDGRITTDIYEPNLPVNTAWDLGHSNATAIWFFQTSNFQIRIIDYYAASKGDLGHFVNVLTERAARPGKNERGYKYDNHYLPHDVAVKVLGMERTRLQTLQQLLGADRVRVVPKLGIDDGINAVHRIFPLCWFDAGKCAEGLKAMRNYHREYDDLRKVFYEKPHHNWASDAADAFRYLAISIEDPKPASKKSVPKPDLRWIY